MSDVTAAKKPRETDDVPVPATLRKSLKNRHIQLIALGGAIGTGLFYGSSESIALAGPSILLAYLIGGLIIFLIVRALSEMAVEDPKAGAFSYYATRYWSKRAGFISGWNYWFNYVLVSMVELAVVGSFVNYWFPNIPQWASAAFFLVAGAIVPGSELTIKNVGVNPTRTGVLDVLRDMGADITESNFRDEAEPMCDLTVKYSKLHGVEIGGAIIPRLIDELPVIAVAAAFAEGETVIRDAQELKVKESNRIAAMVAELTKAGVDVEETDDGMIVHGGAKPHGASFETYKDHRIAMSLAVLGLAAEGASRIDEPEVVAISYPDFFNTLERLGD